MCDLMVGWSSLEVAHVVLLEGTEVDTWQLSHTCSLHSFSVHQQTLQTHGKSQLQISVACCRDDDDETATAIADLIGNIEWLGEQLVAKADQLETCQERWETNAADLEAAMRKLHQQLEERSEANAVVLQRLGQQLQVHRAEPVQGMQPTGTEHLVHMQLQMAATQEPAVLSHQHQQLHQKAARDAKHLVSRMSQPSAFMSVQGRVEGLHCRTGGVRGADCSAEA